MKDKLRIVTKVKEINVIEARSIEELGYSGPNTKEFLECVKVELNINSKNKGNFDFNEKGTTPRVLIGLKSGSLLAKQLSEENMIKLDVEKPFLSPNLQVWSTPINSKLLITGSLGVDPRLVEEKNNYPRFVLMAKENDSEEQIEKKLEVEIKKLEETLKEKFVRKETRNDEKCLSLKERKEGEKPNHFPPTPHDGVGNETTAAAGTSDSNREFEPAAEAQNAVKSSPTERWELSHEVKETDMECTHVDCIQNCSSPQMIQCSTDRIYVTNQEILVLPADIHGKKNSFTLNQTH